MSVNEIRQGYRLFDEGTYKSSEYFVFGRRSTGFFDVRTIDGAKINKGSISVKKLKFIGTQTNYLIERRKAILICKKAGV